MTREEILKAVKEKADLRGADLFGADLFGADLYGADLRGADLSAANLCGANLCGANLSAARLFGANLSGANLRRASLCGADLCEANLFGADLFGADLTDIKNLTYSILPHGEITGWKKLREGIICELLIARDTPKVCSPVGRKCRTSKALVISLSEGEVGYSTHDKTFEYRVGQTVETELDEDIRIECGKGIHFFITREEAVAY